MAGSGIQHTAMVRPRLSGILARALLGTVAALSTGAATGGLLEVVGKREDLTPWRDMPAATVDAWLRKGIRFDSDDEALVSKFYYAKLVYLANLLKDGTYSRPFLIEGGVYRGMWFESVPVTMQVFARIDLPAAKIQLREFVRLQMPDGYIPYKIIPSGPGERSIGFGWIAFAVWHLHLLDGDRIFLEEMYAPLGRWIAWLDRYRDSNRNGVHEAWSPGDVGHDNSARFKGLPLHVDNLRVAPVGKATPYDAPDVSGLVYLEMRSLAEIAEILGKRAEADKWRESAEALRGRVNALLWDPASASYYDRDSSGQFVKMLSDVLLRATYCGLPTDAMAREIFERHILNPAEFWTACPLPSFALNDPLATPDKPDTWSGPTFPLTNLRAPYGFLVYGRRAELRELDRRYLAAVVRQPACFQQYHPTTGEGGAAKSVLLYSPGASVVLDAIARLYGIVPRGKHLEWSSSLPDGARRTRFEFDLDRRSYRLDCAPSGCDALLDGRRIFRARLGETTATDFSGRKVPLDRVRDFPR